MEFSKESVTLRELAAVARMGERSQALDSAIHHQANIRGERLVIRELLKVIGERQKASVLAEIVLATEGCGDQEAEGLATSFQLVKFVFHGDSKKATIVQGDA